MGFSIKENAKKSAKKPAAKKSAPAKKPAAKKAVAKKPVPAKKPAAKKPAPVKKSASAKPQEPAKAKKEIKRVPPRIIRKPPVIVKPAPKPIEAIDTAKAVAFAMSIAQEMKRSARKEDVKRSEGEIRLSRRPTTRAQGKNTAKFPDADLREFRKKLIEAREKAKSGIDAMKATGFNESDDHEADGGDGTNQTLRLQALGQMGVINRTIQQKIGRAHV